VHQNLKTHMDKSFLLFYKSYTYITNTKKPWDKLTIKERERKNFKWRCQKMFILANGEITQKDVEDHYKNCPEMFEYVEGTNTYSNEKVWPIESRWTEIYPPFPLTEYDAKLLINTIGLRMCHFINVNK